MSTYKCTETYEDGNSFDFYMRADMTQASAPILFSYDLGGVGLDSLTWESTPHQTATACHDSDEAARLVSDYAADCGGDTYAEEITVREVDDSDYEEELHEDN